MNPELYNSDSAICATLWEDISIKCFKCRHQFYQLFCICNSVKSCCLCRLRLDIVLFAKKTFSSSLLQIIPLILNRFHSLRLILSKNLNNWKERQRSKTNVALNRVLYCVSLLWACDDEDQNIAQKQRARISWLIMNMIDSFIA